MQFEYATLTKVPDSIGHKWAFNSSRISTLQFADDTIIYVLNCLGADGWQLCAVDGDTYYLKRVID